VHAESLEVIAGISIVGGVVYLLRMIFNFIIKMRGNGKASSGSAVANKALSAEDHERLMDVVNELENVDWKLLEAQQRDLWNWHNERDEDGVPRWYVRKSLEESIKSQGDITTELTKAVDRLAGNTANQTEMISRLIDVLTHTRS